MMKTTYVAIKRVEHLLSLPFVGALRDNEGLRLRIQVVEKVVVFVWLDAVVIRPPMQTIDYMLCNNFV